MIDRWDIEELAYRAMGKTEAEAEEAIEGGDINEAIYEKYGCSLNAYCAIIEDVIRFTPLVESPMTCTRYHAFVDNDRAIVKVKALNNN